MKRLIKNLITPLLFFFAFNQHPLHSMKTWLLNSSSKPSLIKNSELLSPKKKLEMIWECKYKNCNKITHSFSLFHDHTVEHFNKRTHFPCWICLKPLNNNPHNFFLHFYSNHYDLPTCPLNKDNGNYKRCYGKIDPNHILNHHKEFIPHEPSKTFICDQCNFSTDAREIRIAFKHYYSHLSSLTFWGKNVPSSHAHEEATKVNYALIENDVELLEAGRILTRMKNGHLIKTSKS